MNELLQKTVDAIKAKVQPQLLPVVEKIVAAGEKVMYSPDTRDMMVEQLKSSDNPAEAVGEGAAKLMGVLFNQSKKTLPMEAAIPAATILMCEGMDFMEQAGSLEITPDVLAQATQAMASNLLQLVGVTPEKMQGMMAQHQDSEGADDPMPEEPEPAAVSGIVGSAKGV